MGSRMYWMVQRAATADGADKSGLTALTWPVVANFAVDCRDGRRAGQHSVLCRGQRGEQVPKWRCTC